MGIDAVIRELIREELKDWIAAGPVPDPELISVQEAAKFCSCSRSVIDELIKEREKNGFPAVMLGPRTQRIDKRRLAVWFQNGGLAE